MGLLDVEIGGGLVLLLQEQEQRRWRQVLWFLEVEGRVAGAGDAAGEARAQGRCRVTVGMVG